MRKSVIVAAELLIYTALRCHLHGQFVVITQTAESEHK